MPRQSRFDAILPAPFGALGVRVEAEALSELVFLPPSPLGGGDGGEGAASVTSAAIASPQPLSRGERGVLSHIETELAAYFHDPRHRFDLPLAPVGTPFRQRVWRALLAIPPGLTVSYGEIARRVGSAPRAVGQAVGDNPIPIIIPCHRVVAADGGLGGFMHSRTGYSQDIKRWLLTHEHALPPLSRKRERGRG